MAFRMLSASDMFVHIFKGWLRVKRRLGQDDKTFLQNWETKKQPILSETWYWIRWTTFWLFKFETDLYLLATPDILQNHLISPIQGTPQKPWRIRPLVNNVPLFIRVVDGTYLFQMKIHCPSQFLTHRHKIPHNAEEKREDERPDNESARQCSVIRCPRTLL